MSIRPHVLQRFETVDASGALVRQYKYVKVRAGGVPTTVRVPAETFERLISACGSAQSARRLVRNVAETAPRTANNRSGWTTDRLNLMLSESRIERTPRATPVRKPAAPLGAAQQLDIFGMA